MSTLSFRQVVAPGTQFGDVPGAGRIVLSNEIGKYSGDVWIENLAYTTNANTPGSFQAWLVPVGQTFTFIARITIVQITQAELTAGGFATTNFSISKRIPVPRSGGSLWDVICLTNGKTTQGGINLSVSLDPAAVVT